MTSDEAFKFLDQEASQELRIVQEQGAAHMKFQGNSAEARQALERAEQIKAVLASLQELKKCWKPQTLPVMMVQPSEPDVRHRTSSWPS